MSDDLPDAAKTPRRSYPLKRPIDAAASALLLVLLSPFLLVIAGLLLGRHGRPIFFRQERPGLGGRPFSILKFRTMREICAVDFHDDRSRLTRLGSVLRRTSLDELPELWNVLRGDMSLVGPRPLLPRYLPYYTERERLRHSVRPGITGWAQINGRNAVSWDERLAMDVWYVENLGPGLDLRILVTTVARVFGSTGVSVVPGETMRDLDVERAGR